MHTPPPRRRPVITALLACAALAAAPAGAADLIVTDTGDGPTSSCAPQDCSLREAVLAANLTPEDDRILMGPGTHTLALAGADDTAAAGDLDIGPGLVTLVGAGADATTVDGGGVDRVFHVLTGGRLVLTGLTVRGGAATGGGGAVLSGGDLVLRRTTLTANTATADGSAIEATAGSLDLGEVTVAGNTAGSGAALRTQATVVSRLERVRVTGNSTTGSGPGGIENLGTMLIAGSTISTNTAGLNSSAGGVRNQSGVLTITDSTIAGNTSPTSDSGGLFIPAGLVSLRRVTISGNTADSNGGALRSQGTAAVLIEDSTITGNSSSADPVAALGDSRMLVRGSIVAGNGGDGCGGTLVSLGGNLSEAAGCAALAGAGDTAGADPLLGPLSDNGGPTQTHALLAGSPALDAGGDGCAPADQRGVGRPLGGACDAGAVEAQPDVSVSVLDDTPVAPPGATQTVTVRVTNAGVAPATAVTLAIRSSPAVERLSLSATQGTCTPAGGCLLGTIAPGAVVGVTLGLRLAADGAGTVDAQATTPGDADPGNDRDALGVAAAAPAVGPVPVAPVPADPTPVAPTPPPAVRPLLLALPRLTGVARVGRTLRCTGARFAGATARRTSWLRGARIIRGQTRVAYRLRAADRGRVVACAVRATGPGGATRVVSLGRLVVR